MLWKMIRFECYFYSKQLIYYAAAAAFFLLAMMIISQGGLGESKVYINSPFAIAYTLGLLSLFSILAVTMLCAVGLLRDKSHQMSEIIFSSRINKFQYLFSRFAGILSVAFSILCFAALGCMIGTLLPWIDHTRVSPLHLVNYIWPLIIYVLPNLLMSTSVLFTIALLTRSAMATYIGGLALYCLYFVAAALLNSPLMAQSTPASESGMKLAALLDPLGISAFFEQTRYWTVIEKNTELIKLSGNFLQNRAIWSGIALLILAGVYRRFSLRIEGGRAQRVESSPAEERRMPEHVAWRPVSTARPAIWDHIAVLGSLIKLEIQASLLRWPFLIVLLLWIVIVISEFFSGAASGNGGSPSYPTTDLLIWLIADPLGKIGALIIIFYSGELVWREREYHTHELIDSTRISNGYMLLSKYIAIGTIPLLLIGMSVIAAVFFQAASDFRSLEWLPHLSLLYTSGLPLLLLSVLAVFCQIVSPGKYTGMMLMLICFFIWHGGALTGVEHHLFRYASAPAVEYTAMNGFGHYFQAFNWFMIYWSSATGIVVILSSLLWRRGLSAGLTERIKGMQGAWGTPGKLALITCALIFILSGSYVFYNTNILNTYSSTTQNYDWRAAYEKKYKYLEGVIQPHVTAARLEVQLYPRDRKYQVNGTYLLTNKSAAAISNLYITKLGDVKLLSLLVPGGVTSNDDLPFGVRTITLKEPLSPGKSISIGFDVAISNPGFSNNHSDNSINQNGSYIFFSRFFPRLGYRKGFELSLASERRRRGLSAGDPDTAGDSIHGSEHLDESTSRLRLDITISTEADQLAVAPGNLLNQWNDGNRSYFHYKTDHPVTPFFGIVSARYATRTIEHGGIGISIYYHPAHHYNIDHMLTVAANSLDYCQAAFGIYPHDHLRIVELPPYWNYFSGVAFSGMVGFQSNRAFLADLRRPETMDLVLRRTAHEVAHQWWGHQLNAADKPGGTILVESLAKYTELKVIEQMHGKPYTRQFISYEIDRYLRGRAGESNLELPLSQAENQPYLSYSKGAVVMYAISDLIGEQEFNRALSNLIITDTTAVLTIGDFLYHLRSATPDEWRQQVDEWMNRIVLYDLKIDSADSRQLDDGRYLVRLTTTTRKFETTGTGEERAVPMRDSLYIGIYTKHPDMSGEVGETLHIEKYLFDRNRSEFEIRVKALPAYVSIDPYLLRIDRNRYDNTLRIENHSIADNPVADFGMRDED